MTLQDVMRLYDAELHKTRKDPTLSVSPDRSRKGQHIVYSLVDKFSLLFWRLCPDGYVAAGHDFEIPSVLQDDAHEGLAPLHKHNYLEISYVYRGSFSQNINGVDHTFRAGDVWIMDHNCLHQERMLGHDCFVAFFDMKSEFFDDLFDQAFRDNPAGIFIKETLMEKRNENRFIHFRIDEPDRDVERIFNYVLEERALSRPGSEYVLKGLFISLFALLAVNYSFQVTEQKQQALNQTLYNQVVRYMQDHLRDITLERLAQVFSFDKRYLSRLLQTTGGVSYKELLQQVRLERAAEYLTESARSVNEIADEIGYHNITYFYQLFRRCYGMTPKQYRERLGK